MRIHDTGEWSVPEGREEQACRFCSLRRMLDMLSDTKEASGLEHKEPGESVRQ